MALICRALFLSGEDSVLQHDAGLLSEAAFESYVAAAKTYFSAYPGMRVAWRLSENQYGTHFRSFCNSLLAGTPSTQSADAYSQWRTLLRSETNGAPSEP